MNASTGQPGQAGTAPTTEKPTEEELAADIRETREQLADTVDALAHKLDVSERAKAGARRTGAAIQDKADTAIAKLPPPAQRGARQAMDTILARPLPFAAAAVAVFLVLRMVLRRRSS